MKSKTIPETDAAISAACGHVLSDKELPFQVDGETYCPQCFVWHRSYAEPGRWQNHSFRAIECQKCKIISVDCGLDLCGQCGNRSMKVLDAK